MKLYLAFILVFAVLGMFTRAVGAWTYLLIAGSAVILAGLYLFSQRAWA
ncbi:MAG TPA: hypothetical protein VFY79_09260 [Dehalococcoidia bacterium]|jgi:hypothetical protein|nr:hypothetical protein [Dehalococcoidia bacterium]